VSAFSRAGAVLSVLALAVALAGPGRPALADAPIPRPLPPAGQVPEPGLMEETVSVPIFGKVRIVRPEPVQQTRAVVLFLSGEGGFGRGLQEVARSIASRAIVAGLPLPAWKKLIEKSRHTCWFPAGELEETTQAIEKIYHLPRYLKPILVGFEQGGTIAYAAIAQAPAEAFAGAISLGFCPRLEVSRPLCGRGDWKPVLSGKIRRVTQVPPRADLAARPDGTARWTILQGGSDRTCDLDAVARFASSIPAARVVPIPKAGRGLSSPHLWETALRQSIDPLLDPQSAWEASAEERSHLALARAPSQIRQRLETLDLPLEVEWPEAAEVAIVFVSGDGGWAELDQRVADGLNSRGVAVVGWNALRYFWSPKTPARFRADLEKVLGALPEEMPIFAGGYSFGAEVVPATAALAIASTAAPAAPFAPAAPTVPPTSGALPSAPAGPASPEREGESPASPPADSSPSVASQGAGGPLARLAGLVLLAPGPYASYEVSPLDWLRTSEAETKHSVPRSIAALKSLPILCLEPSDHAATGCPEGAAPGLTRIVLPGGHHFAGDFGGIADRILTFIRTVSSRPGGAAPANARTGM